MTNRIAFIFTLSFSFLFGVDTPKEIETSSQIITEIQFDADAFQQNQQIKKGMIETYKQARKAKSIPKPAGSPIYISNQKSGKALKKETSAKKILGDEVHLEKRENAKQNLDELIARSEQYRQKKKMSEREKNPFARMGLSQQPRTNRVDYIQKRDELSPTVQSSIPSLKQLKNKYSQTFHPVKQSIKTFPPVKQSNIPAPKQHRPTVSGLPLPSEINQVRENQSLSIKKYIPSGETFELSNGKGTRERMVRNPDYDWNMVNESRDDFGYEYMYDDNDFEWIELETADTLWLDDDDGEYVTLPGDFPFYDNSNDMVGISSNGWLHFPPTDEDTIGTDYDGLGYIWSTFLPSDTNSSVPAPVIAVYATDGYSGNDEYYYDYEFFGYVTYGETEESFVITWHNWGFCCSEELSDNYEMQAILYPDGDFVLQYQNVYMDDYYYGYGSGYNDYYTIGMQNVHRDDGITVMSNDTTMNIYSGMRLKFDHPGDFEDGELVDCVCDAQYHVGDRVVLTVDNPDGNENLYAGQTGTVYCGGETPFENADGDTLTLLVAWDPDNSGHENTEYCECGDGDDIDLENNAWWVSCNEIEMENDEDWTFLGEFDGHEYWLSGFEATWNDASMLYDYEEEVHLVTISSRQENIFIQENVGDSSVWIGFTDEAEEGNWQWITGEEVTYTNWADGEPNGGEVENGCELLGDGTWNDQNVNSLRRFVFEVEVDSTGGGDYFIEGIVRDFDGNPIPGAIANAESEGGGFWSTEADEEGYYYIDNDSLNGMAAVFATADGYNFDLTTVYVSEGGTQYDFSLGLLEETTLIGVLAMTSNGDPVSFAEVHSPQSPQEMSYTAWTGWDFVTVYPSDGFADIYGFSEEYGEAYVYVDNIEAGVYYSVELVFEDDTTGGDYGTVSGGVYDSEGNPVDSSYIYLFNEDSVEVIAFSEFGDYYSVELPPGHYSAYAFSGADTSLWGDFWDGGVFHLEEGSEMVIDFELFPHDEFAFVIATVPTEMAYVEIENGGDIFYSGYTNWWNYAGSTVPPGEYNVHVWVDDQYQEQSVSAEAGSMYFLDFDIGGGDYGAIYGSVQDMDGSRIPYAEVVAWNYDYLYIVTTDENGDYFMEVPAGYYDMEAWAEGYTSEMNWVEVYPNEYSWVEFWLYPEDDYNTVVHGHVHDVDGNPLSFANVNASYLYDDWESEGTFTNEDGYYELYLRDDAYRITAGAEGFWVSAYDSIYVGGDSLWLDFMLSPVGEFDGGWQGNINLVGNHDPELIYLAIMSEDYQVFRILSEPGPQEVELMNGNYHIFAGADGYQEVFIPNAINIENNVVNFDIHLIQEGLLLPPQIEFAGDVPNDQGRQMRLVWNPGVPGDWGYFEFFSIWRQVNEAPMILWDFIDVVPWHGMEAYSAVVPTLGDSTDMGIYWSTFRVTGHTENPNEFYDSAPVTGYSIDNLHPGAPGGVQAFTGGDGILLTWDSSMDEDFGYHRIYRHDTDSGDPAMEFTTVDTFYVDNAAEGNYEYWITAVDLNGNESDPSIIVTVTLAIDNGLAVPIEFALQQNYPNPFNPSTQIQYALPTDANVTIAIYDLVGRQVRTLVNQQVTAGYHSTLWNATNNMGSPVSAGVYIYTITANDFRDVKKMILLK